MKRSLSALALILLASCGRAKEAVITASSECFNRVLVEHGTLIKKECPTLKEWRVFSTGAFQLNVPGSLYRFDNSLTETVFDTKSDNTPAVNRDYSIRVFAREELPANASCSPHILGASKVASIPNTTGTAMWGRSDFWDRYSGEGGLEEEGIVCTNYATPHYQSVYGFCSENNGRTVVICVNEMADNPTLAEEIFKTFRWTK